MTEMVIIFAFLHQLVNNGTQITLMQRIIPSFLIVHAYNRHLQNTMFLRCVNSPFNKAALCVHVCWKIIHGEKAVETMIMRSH